MITAAIATACLLVGYMLGLFGYAQASRHAYRRFIAAQGRASTPPRQRGCSVPIVARRTPSIASATKVSTRS